MIDAADWEGWRDRNIDDLRARWAYVCSLPRPERPSDARAFDWASWCQNEFAIK